jgi:hypothetical protein
MIRAHVKTVVGPINVVFSSSLTSLTYPVTTGGLAGRVDPTGVHWVGTTWLHERVQGRRATDALIEVVEYQPNPRLTIKSASKGFDKRVAQISVRSVTTRPSCLRTWR